MSIRIPKNPSNLSFFATLLQIFAGRGKIPVFYRGTFAQQEFTVKDFFFWALAYQLVSGLCSRLRQWLSLSGWVTAAGLAVFLLVLVLWSIRTDRAKALGICLCSFPKKTDLLLAGVLLLPAAVNLAAGGLPSVSLWDGCIVLCAAALEEVLFRGFAFQAFGRKSALRGILGSAALFAVLHGLNLFHAAPADVLLQALFAFFAGICYAGAAVRTGSLLPCAAAHCLTNLTGYGFRAETARPLYGVGIGVYALVSILYLLRLRRKCDEI